jgi:hypothetical protein
VTLLVVDAVSTLAIVGVVIVRHDRSTNVLLHHRGRDLGRISGILVRVG